MVRNGLDDGLFHVVFVTTPSRLSTPRFAAYFKDGPPSELRLSYLLKRREPVALRGESGLMEMGWGPSCSDEEFKRGCLRLLELFPDSSWINVEEYPSTFDLELLGAHPSLGALLSGPGMSPTQARMSLDALPISNPVVLALESEDAMLAGPDLMTHRPLAGLVIGTSYLSESSRVYDQMGLGKYRSLMRGLAKKAAGIGCRPYTTSSYCTFEPSGLGDKNKDFVSQQVAFVSQYPGWGSLTRFYSHLDVAQRARLAYKQAKRNVED